MNNIMMTFRLDVWILRAQEERQAGSQKVRQEGDISGSTGARTHGLTDSLSGTHLAQLSGGVIVGAAGLARRARASRRAGQRGRWARHVAAPLAHACAEGTPSTWQAGTEQAAHWLPH